MQIDRRHFVRIGAGGAMGGLLRLAAQQSRPKSGIKLGVSFTPRPQENDFAMLRYSGVEAVSIWTTIEDNSLEWMLATRKRVEANGIEVYNIGILDLHCDPTIVLGLDGVETKIAQYQQYLNNLGRAGIHYTTYAHMANIKIQMVPGYYQTAIQTARGGAPTREFDLEVARKLPNSHGREYGAEQIWSSFTRFIRAVIPVAEKNKVRIGLHPDDPPVDTLGGVARVFRNVEGYERAFQIAGSENFGICLCIGTWGGRRQDDGSRPGCSRSPFRRQRKDLQGALPQRQLAPAPVPGDFRGRRLPGHVPGDEGVEKGQLQRHRHSRPCPGRRVPRLEHRLHAGLHEGAARPRQPRGAGLKRQPWGFKADLAFANHWRRIRCR